MPAGLEIFSAVTSAVALTLQIHTFFQTQLKEQEPTALIHAIRNDSAVLRDFACIFDAAVKDDLIPQTDKLLLNDISLALQPSLINMQAWIVRQRTAHLTASAAQKVTNLVVGFLYKRSELERIAAELFHWTERYHIRLSLMPLALRERLLNGAAAASPAAALTSLAVLRNTFSRLTLQTERFSDASVTLVEQNIVLRPGVPSSRMFALSGSDAVIVEFRGHPSTLAGDLLAAYRLDVVRLVKMLNCADSSLCRILKAAGYFHQPARHCFALVYEVPPRYGSAVADATTPTTLLDLIKATRKPPAPVATARSSSAKASGAGSSHSGGKGSSSGSSSGGGGEGATGLLPPLHPLESRFELARKIACAVMYVHTMNYVHKSIRTANIVVLKKKTSASYAPASAPAALPPPPPPPPLPNPADIGSGMLDLLQHLGEPFLCGFETARHDRAASDQQGDAHWPYNIYRHPQRQGLHPQERYMMNHDIYSLGVVLLELGLWKPLLLTGLSRLKGTSEAEVEAGAVREYLKRLAGDKLPALVGTKYCETVLFCLGIDGDAYVSKSTIIEEVLRRLEELSAGLL